MKKSTVVKLYNELDNKEILKKGLPRMINVKGDAEDIFCDLCIKYNDILNSDILDHFISISTFSSSLDDNLERKKLLNGIYNILDNDYLVSNMDFNIILENIEYIMGTMFSPVFDVYDEDEEKYYTSEIIVELSNGLSKSKNYDINKIYDHDLDVIFSRFFSVLEDLNNTNIPDSEYYNETLMNRVKAFLDIIFSKEIYELDDYKYDVVLDIASTIEDVNISKMVEFASDVLSDRKDKLINLKDNAGYSQLVLLGTSAGGARAKVLIAWNEDTGEIKSGQINAGDGFEYWLMKFDGVSKNGDHNLEDSVEYTRIEYGYYLMAKAAGVIMNECRLLEDAGYAHFITKRFDRNNNKKIHMQTLGAISHIDYNIPGLCSYEQAAYYMNRLGIPYSDVEQFYRRMVFNVILINQDDHVKNVSFLMDKNGVWRLSPAYDVTFAYDSSNMWLKAHQMLINGKSSDISYGDLIKCGINMGVSKRKCDAIISYIEDVAKRFSDYMEMAGVREKTCQIMNDIIISNNIRKTGD